MSVSYNRMVAFVVIIGMVIILKIPTGTLRALTMVWKLDRVVSEILEPHGDGKYTKFPTGKLRSPSSYRSLSDDGTYWEEITNIAFYLYNGGDCSDGFYVGGRVRNSYGISLYQEKNIYRSPIISFNNSYAYLVELDGLVFNYNWDFGNSCGHFLI